MVFSDSSLPASSEGPCDYTEPTWIIQDNSHLKIFNLITSTKSLPPSKVTCTIGPRRHWFYPHSLCVDTVNLGRVKMDEGQE
jgi:hypothetical protein